MLVVTLGVLVVLVVLTTAGTVWLVKTRPCQEHDPDTKFWYGFAGLCVLAPTILISAAASPWAALTLLAVSAGTGCWVNKLASHSVAVRIATTARSQHAREQAALAARHEEVLTRWSRYELDPGAAIDFPSMSDVRVPETSALVKAAALAGQLRRDTDGGTSPGGQGEPSYSEAIMLLELAFHRAEQSARSGATAGRVLTDTGGYLTTITGQCA